MNKKPAQNAVLVVIRLADSVMLDFARSDKDGKFNMSMPMDTVEVLISHPQFDDKSVFFFPSPKNLDLNLTDLPLPPPSEELAEIMIVAYKEPIYFKGDTLVYNADMFETKENAVVEDLLKKLPGITVDREGNISSQGREVSKVLVDGDEFFGDDPTVATKNLGADGVESVRIYETEDEDAQAGSDEKIQVMDLRLKEDAKKGYFGRVSAASDFQNFYEGELLLNKFKGRQKISVFALGSNTPRSGFNWAEANKFGLTNEFYAGDNAYYQFDRQLQGIPRTFKAGVYYTDKLSDKIKFGANYTYNNNSMNKVNDQTSQYFLQDTTYYTDEVSNSLEEYESHLINLDFNMQIDSLTTLHVEPRLQYNKAANLTISQTTFRTADQDTSSVTDIFNNQTQDSYEASARARLEREFNKKDRELTVIYNYFLNQNKTNTILTSESNYRFAPFLNDSIDQLQEQEANSSTHNGQIYFNEPLTKHFSLGLDYFMSYGVSDQEKITNNAVLGEYVDYDSILSNSFSTNRFLNRGGVKLTYQKNKITVSGGAQFRNVKIDNIDLNGDAINQNINNFLPNASFRVKFSKSKRLRINYTTQSAQPSITQLQPVPDNRDPNRISIGNSELRPNYTHTVTAGFNTWKALSGFYLWTQASMSVINDAFSSSVYFDSLGRTVSQTVNVQGNQNANWYFGTGLPINPEFKVEPSFNASYFKNSNYVNDVLNTTETTGLTGEMKVEYNRDNDSLSLFAGGSYTYNNPQSTLSFNSNQPFSTQQFYGGFEVELPLKMTLEAEARYTINSQRADGYNINFLIIDAALSKRFLKTENLVLSFNGNDILNQNVLANRTIQGNVIVDNRATIISRYFLVKLMLKFNSTKTHEKDPGFHW